MHIVIYDNTMYTSDLSPGDLCIKPYTKPLKFYIVHDILFIDDKKYYIVADTRYDRKFKIKNNLLIKKYNHNIHEK